MRTQATEIGTGFCRARPARFRVHLGGVETPGTAGSRDDTRPAGRVGACALGPLTCGVARLSQAAACASGSAVPTGGDGL